MDKRRAVENMIDRLGRQASVGQIADALRRYDVDVSESFIAKIKSRMERDDARAVRQRAARPPKSKRRRRPQQRKIPQRRR